MNRLKDIVDFSEDFPLIFTQINFWIFFAIAYFLFALLYKRIQLRNSYLLLVSLFFYYKTSGLFVGILLFSTVSDYFIGKYIHLSVSELKRKVLVTLSVCINLFTLSYFKYAYFFTDSYNELFHTNYEVVNWLAVWANGFSDASYFTVDAIILPVGISFYTFQTISYSVDIYRRKLTPLRSIFDFGFYVSFFPQLVAGPIVRAENFVPQITKPTRVTSDHFNKGSFMILKGLIKKMIFADYIAMHFMDQVFDAPEMYSGFTNIMALFGYSLQIYGDFSGYTDIAIGLALLMGFELPVNFKSPYKAINCGDFWKRWHISLSTWLRDYLYIPLGGNRKGTKASFIILGLILTGVIFALGNPIATTIIVGIVVTAWILARRIPIVANHINTNINLMLTMLIGGLWHGASWKFVLWGGLNGLGIVVYKYWRRVSPYEAASGWFVHAWKITLTFLFITYVRIYFRGESMEHIGKWYRQIANNMDWGNAIEVLTHYKIVFIIMLLGYITHWLPQGLKNAIERYYAVSPVFVKGLVVTVISVICYQAFSSDFQPFIYFQF